jgi:uncharacterized protein YkwD
MRRYAQVLAIFAFSGAAFYGITTIEGDGGIGPATDSSVPQLRVQDQAAIFALTNAARQANGKPALKASAMLNQAAEHHALNMAKQEKMDHVLDGKDFNDRIKSVGYDGSAQGENIGVFYGSGDLNKRMVDTWMASPVHHDNILSISQPFTEIGIGVAISASGKLYFCQDFGKP